MTRPLSVSVLSACAVWLVLVGAVPARASEACDGGPRTDSRGAAAVWRELFAYDAAAPLRVEVAGSKAAGAATIQDVTFVARPDRPAERVAAYIVAPATPRPAMAAVLWVHWLGEPATTNRTEFLDEATAMAGHGVVSVLVDGGR